jgi:uncharacterized membrane protein YgcG
MISVPSHEHNIVGPVRERLRWPLRLSAVAAVVLASFGAAYAVGRATRPTIHHESQLAPSKELVDPLVPRSPGAISVLASLEQEPTIAAPVAAVTHPRSRHARRTGATSKSQQVVSPTPPTPEVRPAIATPEASSPTTSPTIAPSSPAPGSTAGSTASKATGGGSFSSSGSGGEGSGGGSFSSSG